MPNVKEQLFATSRLSRIGKIRVDLNERWTYGRNA